MNKYIDKIGIEYEGFFNYSLIDELESNQPEWLEEIKHDGSLNDAPSGMIEREITTNPIPFEDVDKSLDFMAEVQKSGEYTLDRSVGLHYHISVNDDFKPYLVNTEFLEAYRTMFEKMVPEIYKKRVDNSYCKFEIQPRSIHDHFRFTHSSDRYTAVNYCFDKHNTIEFRAYGGVGATITELKRLIHATCNLINTWESKYHRLKREAIGLVNRGNRAVNYSMGV